MSWLERSALFSEVLKSRNFPGISSSIDPETMDMAGVLKETVQKVQRN